MPEFKPIRQSRVSEEVAEQLKQSILRGEFEPGAKLPSERILSEQFGVSRLSVREALHRLKTLGFVATKQGVAGGAYVIDLNFQYLADAFSDLFLAGKISVPELYQVRVYLEPEIARMAASAITPEHAARLTEASASEEHPSRTLSEQFQKMTAVHSILAHICGNRFYEGIVRSTLDLTFKYLRIVDSNLEEISFHHPDFDVLHPPGSHREIVEAVAAGDPENAVTAMRRHLSLFAEVLLKLEDVYRKGKQ